MLNFSLNKEVRRLHQPKKLDIKRWLQKSLVKTYQNVHLDICIVSSDTSKQLNYQYRSKDYPTNVISLEYQDSRDNFNLLYGELFLCDDVIIKEAQEQHKSITEHYAHMVIHGVLHLQGFDHQNNTDANIMEELEIRIMHELGFKNPYI